MELDYVIFNAVYPIVRVKVYAKGYEVERKSQLKYKPENVPARGTIKKRSQKSLSRLAFIAATTTVKFASLMTLTYPHGKELTGRMAQQKFGRFLKKARRQFGHFSYLWFLEFQKRGTPHYHILTSVGNTRQYKREQFAKMWAVIVAMPEKDGQHTCPGLFHVKQLEVEAVHRRPEAWEMIRKKDGAMRYMLKYALKSEQVKVPESFFGVGRFWGHSKDVKPEPLHVIDVEHAEFLAGLAEEGNPCALFDVCPRFIIRRSKLDKSTSGS